ncbi:adenosine receptor A2b-like [Babylonia areolata]|uniref:adenosine receptor A2b-like n=1 Tax=Babylonia areolata TaxID=304850 RepID=UPI003FD5FF2D
MAHNGTAGSPSPPFPIPELCHSPAFWNSARVIVALTLVLVVVTNALLVLVTWRAAGTRINPFLFGSLAMSDLLTGLLVLPFHLSFAIEMDTSRAVGGPAACVFSGVLFHILQTISLYSFFALSLDRLLSIECPLRYPSMMTWKVNMAAVATIWTVPALSYGLVPATGLGTYEYKCWQSMCNLGDIDAGYLTFLLLSSSCVFLGTYVLNGRIFWVARKQGLKTVEMAQHFRSQTGKKLNMGDRLKAAKSILLALSLFTVCWGPYYTALFCFVLFRAMTTPLTEFGLLWLAISNSYMNFFVFVATYRSFRQHFLHMIGVKNRVGTADITIISSS